MVKRKNYIGIIDLVIVLLSVVILGIGLIFTWVKNFDRQYAKKIYPNVSVAGINFGGKTVAEVGAYWLSRNKAFSDKSFTFTYGGETATVSGAELNLGFDATLSATQAYLIGRSGHKLSDFVIKFITKDTDLAPMFRWDNQKLDEILNGMSAGINIPVVEALFQFDSGKVTAFRPSHEGRQVNIALAKKLFTEAIQKNPDGSYRNTVINLPVDAIKPNFTTENVNSFGIKSLLGKGYSQFHGSIPERIHNVVLAASLINGILIKPGETFSFNDAVGDISKTTGFLQAYVIQNGRTILGDGGGVCQVSTTLFRAALDAGLPIVERHAHDYRVHYYEEGGFKPGLDATVFAPSFDLKFTNNTPGYILIQTKSDLNNLSLTFELYGTGDGRTATISNHRIWDVTPPPPDLYQDDPTLPKGAVKQVDFAAWGTKASFHYSVVRNGEILEDTDFFSNFKPWQAIYLRGTL